MKKSLLSIAVAGILAAPAYAQQAPTNDEILRQLQALGQRVEKLEQDNTTLRTENEELRAKNDRIEATTEYLRDNASATRKQLAEEGAESRRGRPHHQGGRMGVAHQLEGGPALPARIPGSGRGGRRPDAPSHPRALRPDRQDQRHGAGTIQIATNGGNNDPRSTNQTLGEGNTRKGLGIDLAYVGVEASGRSSRCRPARCRSPG